MKRSVRAWGSLLIGVVGLILTIQSVQARRFIRSDANYFIDITQPCLDGMVVRLASANPGIVTLDAVKKASSTINLVPAGQDFLLEAGPVFIPGGGAGGKDITVGYSGTFTLTYTLLPTDTLNYGTRVHFRLNESNSERRYVTVRNCTLANPWPDPVTAVVPDLKGGDSPIGVIAAGETMTYALDVTKALSMTGISAIGDVNVAMNLRGDENNFDTMSVSAFLVSPDRGTVVQLMDNYVDTGRDFGTRCSQFTVNSNGTLVGDLKADFNIDDESFFSYGDTAAGDSFNFAALRPVEPLSAFDGEDPYGTWKLVVRNEDSGPGAIPVYLHCWFLELTGGHNFVYAPLIVDAGN